nr:immunoglobulin heavy chain junction region [Mus musculus]
CARRGRYYDLFDYW